MLAGEALNRLYAAARLHGNLFQPSFKLQEKRREGARVIKRYHAPEPPVARALAHVEVSETDKARLREMRIHADPVLLLAAVCAAQVELGKHVDERVTGASCGDTPAPIGLAQFTARLKVAWSEGEQQPTHQRRYIRRKPIVRTSLLDAVRDQLLAWLEAQPALSAVDALERLRGLHLDRFGADHLRTVQRFMKVRRATMAREVLLGPLVPVAGTTPDIVLAAGRLAAMGDTEMPGSIPS